MRSLLVLLAITFCGESFWYGSLFFSNDGLTGYLISVLLYPFIDTWILNLNQDIWSKYDLFQVPWFYVSSR